MKLKRLINKIIKPFFIRKKFFNYGSRSWREGILFGQRKYRKAILNQHWGVLRRQLNILVSTYNTNLKWNGLSIVRSNAKMVIIDLLGDAPKGYKLAFLDLAVNELLNTNKKDDAIDLLEDIKQWLNVGETK